jgi:Tol biopolymer transport system component
VTTSPRAAPTEADPRAVPVSTPGLPVPIVSRRAWLLAAALVVLGLAASYVVLLPSHTGEQSTRAEPITTPLTAYPGVETAPSLSPDGNQVAFAWNGPRQDNFDIYVKLVGTGEPVRLTTAPERDDYPAWSSDGRQVAFLRITGSLDGEVFVMPALGGAERRVATITLPRGVPWHNLSWAPDGKWLAVRGRPSTTDSQGIWLFEVNGPNRRRLTTPGPLWMSDVGPVFSADGRRLAFLRQKAISNALFVLPLSPALAPTGEPVLVQNDRRRAIAALDWASDGDSLIHSTGARLAPKRLERIALSITSTPLGRPELLPFGERATSISVGHNGRLVYSAEFRDTNFSMLDLTRPSGFVADAGLAASTLDESAPSYSPDGRQVVFVSTRSGSEELWISNVDGARLRQVTSIGGPSCANPQWSPDGRTILFNSTREGSADLYLLSPDSGEVRRLTTHPAEEVQARWSRDGRWIYFGSNRSSGVDIWKMRAEGGVATQITHDGGEVAQESFDGRSLYYAVYGSPGTIWRVPIAGGERTQVVDGLSHPLNFVVADRGLYFVAVGDAPSKTSVDFVEFSNGQRTTLATIGKPWWFGIALSPDQRWLLFPTIDRDGRDLMLVENVPQRER